MGKRVKDETKSERRIVMTRIGDETIAPRRKPADLSLVTIERTDGTSLQKASK
jgi:hypothetical protein